MMGAAARGAYEMGGKIIGVVPYFFNTPGILFEHCTELIRMETMAERKTIMEERSDAFIALPGGIGTMEEIFEVITLSSLGRMRKKSAFLGCRKAIGNPQSSCCAARSKRALRAES